MKNVDGVKSPILEDLKKENPETRVEIIKAHAYAQEELVYSRDLTEEELNDLQKTYVQNSVQLSRFEEELKKIKEDFKAKMNPLKLLGQEYLNQLRTGKKEVEGIVYDIDDQDNNLMISVDEEGNVLSFRPLRKSEKQLSINSKLSSKEAM